MTEAETEITNEAPVAGVMEILRLDHGAHAAEVAERLRFQHEFGLAGIKALTIANGGALIALFTFIGNADSTFHRGPLWWAFGSFGLGLTAALACYIAAYLSQAHFMSVTLHQSWNSQRLMLGIQATEEHLVPMKKGNRALGTAIGLAVFSLSAFVGGSAFALSGVLG